MKFARFFLELWNIKFWPIIHSCVRANSSVFDDTFTVNGKKKNPQSSVISSCKHNKVMFAANYPL